MCAVLPAHVLPVNQPNVGLVDQRARVQGVPGALVAKVVVRQAVQLLIDQWGQFFECRLVAITPGNQQLRDVLRRARWHTDSRTEAAVYQLFFLSGYYLRSEKYLAGLSALAQFSRLIS